MKSKEQITSELTELLCSYFGLCGVKPEQDLQIDLDMDSLDFVELLMMVEKNYYISISDNKAEDLTNIQKLTNYIYTKQ